MSKRMLVLLLGAVLVGGCGAPTERERAISLVKDDVAGGLKDPDSALFRNIKVPPWTMGEIYVCGEVNAKNGFGAYVGYEAFYGVIEGTGANQKVKFSLVKSDAEKRGVWFYPVTCKG